MDAIDRLKEGYQDFCKAYFSGNDETFKNLVTRGQQPQVLLIGCSDSRVSPCVITRAEPGEIFTIRNVANLVPPYTHEESGHHGVSAAIEFAVRYLKVKHIIVLGHSQCGGIRALLDGSMLDKHDSFISSWIHIAKTARDEIENKYHNASLEDKAYALEQAALKLSLKNLLSFPWVKERVEENLLELHAWHFDLASGKLMELTPNSPQFVPIL